MKLILLFPVLCALLVSCGTMKPLQSKVPKMTFSSFDQFESGGVDKRYGANEINFQAIDLRQFFMIYQELSGRTVISSATLAGPSITLRNQSPVTRIEVLQMFDTALAQNGIAMVLSGEKSVKAVPIAAVGQEAGPVIDLPADQLPDSGSFMVRVVQLKKSKPSELVPVVQPFAKVPNGIIPMDRERVLVLRDFSSNIRQMLKLIEVAESGAGR